MIIIYIRANVMTKPRKMFVVKPKDLISISVLGFAM